MKRPADEYETSVDLYDLEVTCEYDYEPAEREIRYGDDACPGSDARCDLTAVLCKGVDILPLLSARQRGTIENEIIEDKAQDAIAAREAAADASEDR